MTAPVTDNRILSTLWNSLDKRPIDIFGVPAISLTTLYSALNTTYEQTDPNQLISMIQPNTKKLLGSEHGVSLKSIRRGESEEKEYWIVFKPSSSSSSVSKLTSGYSDEGRGENDDVNVKDIEVLPNLPGGGGYQSEHGMSTRGIARDKAKSAKKKIFGVLGLKKETAAHAADDGSENEAAGDDYKQEGVKRSKTVEEQVNIREEYTNTEPPMEGFDGNQVRSQETEEGNQSERGADEDKNGMEEEDWLEQTQKWNKHHHHRHQHDNNTDDRSRTMGKPERKGTEWDIIDAYDYGSDGEDQDQDNANSGGSIEDKKDKVEVKDKFDPSILQKRPSTTRKQTLFENEEFNGKIAEYYERFQNEPVNTQSESTPDGQNDGEGGRGKDEKEGREDKNHYHSEKDKKKKRDGRESDDQHENGDDCEKSRRTRDGHEKHRERPKYKSKKHSDEQDHEWSQGEHEREHKHKHREKHHSRRSRSTEDEDEEKARRHRHRSSDGEKHDKDRKHKHKHIHKHRHDDEHEHRHRSKDPESEKRKDEQIEKPAPPTPFLIKSFKGLPFEPDTNFIDTVSWMGNRWQLIVAELIAVLGTVYIIQATGL